MQMNGIEELLILAGVSLDIFAAMECQGSLVAKINKKQLSAISLLVAFSQLAALFLGHFLSDLFCRMNAGSNEHRLGVILALVIFAGLGIRLMVKAIRNERVEEHLERNLGIRRFLRMAFGSSVYTILAGIAFGFLQTNIVVILVMIAVLTVVFVIGGMYTGYHMGFAGKTTVYIIGALLLWGAGLDVLFGKLLQP
jgi:putative Mn2+ efflux pump MntP